jgi:hypothetical protein
VPTATWFTGQTSAAGGGAGFGTGAYTTTNNSYPSPTAGALLCVYVFGITNAASEITGGALTSSVGSGTNPTLVQHTAGWVTGSAVGSTYTPFATMYYVNALPTCTNLRFICDATDDIYQWFVIWVEYTSFDSGTPFGRWGSDSGSGDTADNEVTTLDQNTGSAIGASSHTVGVLVADGSAGNVAPGTGFTERYEGPSGAGQTLAQVQDDQTSVDDTIEWGAITPTLFEWCTLGIEVRHSAAAVTGPAGRRRRVMRPARGLIIR